MIQASPKTIEKTKPLPASAASPKPASKRELNLLDATMLVVGSMIGSGIFLTSAESARLVGAPGWLLVAWALAGVMTITGALCCAELAAMMPRAGGQFVFLCKAYGRPTGFLFGWALFAVIQTGTIAAVAVAFASFFGVLCPYVSSTNYLIAPRVWGHYAISLSTQQLVAVAMIFFLTGINTCGMKMYKWIQILFTVVKIGALIGMIVLGLTLGWNTKSAAFHSDWWNPWANGWHPQSAQPGLPAAGALALLLLLGRAMTGPLFAQSAWNNVTFAGGEVKDPKRNLPRALRWGCGMVVALYLLANVAYIVTLPLAAIQTAPQNRVAVAMMQAILGRPGTLVMAVAIFISTFGCNNGLMLAGARVYYAMARHRLFFKAVGRRNTRNVPAGALIAQGVWASFLTLPSTVGTNPKTGAVTFGNIYLQLLEYIVSVDLLFYGLMVGAVFVLRKKRGERLLQWNTREQPDAAKPDQKLNKPLYRTWGYPITPIIYLSLTLLLILDLGYLAPTTSGVGYLLVLSGVPVYLLWRRRN